MRFTCNAKDIAGAVAAASKVVNAHTTMPILGNDPTSHPPDKLKVAETSDEWSAVAGYPGPAWAATDDVYKCALKPGDAADYKTPLTAEQLAQMRQTFPDGVCDYSKPGVGQDAKLVTWAVYTDRGQFNGEILVTVGSIEGSGVYILGSKNLTTGSLNTDTEVSGGVRKNTTG